STSITSSATPAVENESQSLANKANPEKASTSGPAQPVTRALRKSTTTSHNSEESICTPVKEQLPSLSKPKNSALATCNGLDETATESEQETSKSSKGPSKATKAGSGAESTTTINGKPEKTKKKA